MSRNFFVDIPNKNIYNFKEALNQGDEAMFRKIKKASYDKENKKPVIRCSICTGEQVAGFKDIKTGKFEDIMLIKTEKDLRDFMSRYDISEIEKDY